MNQKTLITYLWGILIYLLWNCNSNKISKGSQIEPQQQYSISDLRRLYSSGDSKNWPKPFVDSIVYANGFEDIGLLPEVIYPDGNPYSIEKYNLGKLLFHDPRLSSSGQIACASCHDPQLGWGDGKRVAFGHDRQTGKRNAMTLFNTAYYNQLFWDGRANSLEHQATMPVEDPVEMHAMLGDVVTIISKIKEYSSFFKEAYGDEKVTRARIVNAIATFERKIVSPKSRFDLFIMGKSDKLTDQEVLGLHLFRTKARCINCHNTGLFSDNQFHNDGQTLYNSKNEDLGRYKITKRAEDVGKFKTPSLRETMNTGPWMHHGNFPTMKDVILFYNLGNPVGSNYRGEEGDSLRPKNSALLKKLNLTKEELIALEAFLGSITTTPKRMRIPELPGYSHRD